MNKEVLKRNLSLTSNATKKQRCQRWLDSKTLVKIVVIFVLFLEAGKSLAVKAKNGEKVISLALELSGAIFLILTHFIIGIWVNENSKILSRIVKEAFLTSSLILYLFSLHSEFVNSNFGDVNRIVAGNYLLPSLTFLTASLLILELLKASTISKVAITIFLFLYMSLHTAGNLDNHIAAIYLNTTIPIVYIVLLVISQQKLFSKTNQAISVIPTKQSSSSTAPSFSEMIEDSIFTYNKKGEIELVNKFFLKEMTENLVNGYGEVFRKIKEVSLVREERTKKEAKNSHDDSVEENLTSGFDNSEIHIEIHEPNTPTINLVENNSNLFNLKPVSNSNNLDNTLKGLFARIKSKEIKDKRVIHYKGKIESDKKKKVYFLEIKAFICPKTSCPLVVIIKDVSAKHRLKEMKALEKNRQLMLASLVTETNNAVELTKPVLEAGIHGIYGLIPEKGIPPKEDIRTILTSLTHQILTPLINLVTDLDEFGSSARKKLKFNFSMCDIRKLIDEIMTVFAVQAKLLNTKIEPVFKRENSNKLLINSDKKRIKQVLMRLISNSLKNASSSIKIVVSSFPSSVSISVEDNGKGIPPAKLLALQEELKGYSFDLQAFHTKQKKTQGLPIAQMIALGLGPRSSTGLSLKSSLVDGTGVSFIIENKPVLEAELSESFPGSPSNTLLPGKRAPFSPTKPSKFKLTHDYESQDISVSSDFNESAGINNPVNHNLDAVMISRRSGENSPRRYDNSFGDVGLKLNEIKKSKFAEQEEHLRFSNENINEHHET